MIMKAIHLKTLLDTIPDDAEIITLKEAQRFNVNDTTSLRAFGLEMSGNVPDVIGGVLELGLLIVTAKDQSE
jgi:hypothetical protein